MAPSTDQERARHFLVELTRPAAGWALLADVTARARSAASAVRGLGAQVSLVRSVYAPESDSLFLVYMAESEDAVWVALRGAELSPLGVSTAIVADDRGRR
ncbi:MAG TPA: hypothetical protein VMZ33_06150 [Candidatus Limnocylindrales bacterium]|nr:hypothetical protein [Candidatus Limnocylindrales bacterium]